MGPKILRALLFTLTILTITPNLSAFSIQMIRRDSIDSTLFPANLTQEERRNAFHQLDMSRAGDRHSPDALRPRVFRLAGGVYVAQFRIGAERYSPYLIIDTGSADTWLQCEGCTKCFHIRYGSFNPHSSRRLPCDHPLCEPKLCGRDGACLLRLAYLDGTAVRGSVLTDTFSFPTSESGGGPFSVVRDVAFGCGFSNENVVFARSPDNIIAGVFALGFKKRSVLSQLDEQTKGVFSYCLPSWSSQLGKMTLLRFGDDARIVGGEVRRAQRTRFIHGRVGFHLDVVDMSVNTKRLHLNPALFSGGKLAMDTGSSYTYLAGEAYTAVRREITDYFHSAFGWRPRPRPQPGTSAQDMLCYDKSFLRRESRPTSPTLTFHFNGASLVIKPENIFEQYDGWFCMMVFPNSHSDMSFIGAYQMADHLFSFDVKASTMSFIEKEC